MKKTSLSLLEALNDGRDVESWSSLTQIYYPLIEYWISYFGASQAEVDDVKQNVLLVVFRRLPEFSHNGQTGSFRKWLKSITRNCVWEFWRRQKREIVATGKTSTLKRLNQLASECDELNQLHDLEHRRFQLNSLLQIIRPEFRQRTWSAFEKLVLEGGSADRIAIELGVSINSVYISKSRVMTRLREVGNQWFQRCEHLSDDTLS